MPYKSEKQRRLMHAKHPEIAARWDKEYGTKVAKAYPLLTVSLAGRSKLDRKRKTRVRKSVITPRTALNTKRLVAVARNPVKGAGVPTQRRTEAARKAADTAGFFQGAKAGGVRKSAWDIPVEKSLIGHGPNGPIYRAATKVGAKGLKKVRREHNLFQPQSVRNNPTKHATLGRGGNSGGMYKPGTGEKYDEAAARNIREVRGSLKTVTGRDFNKRPRIRGDTVHIKGYPNAHPVAWGGKKDKVSYMVGSKTMLKLPGVRRHELLHADKSSWRLAQIQSDPVKLAREEARADTLSGTYRRNGPLAHTYQNRKTAGKLNPAKTKAALDSAKGKGPVQEAMAQAKHDQARSSHAFKETQEKIDTASGGKYKTQRAYRAKRAGVVGAQGTVVAGTGALAYNDHKKGQQERAKVRKSAWGLVHKLDQSDVHVNTTMTGSKKARRRKLKRIVET